MIKVTVKRNKNDNIYGFKVKNHGPKILCAAVSSLVINTINCIEQFTDEDAECIEDEKKVLIDFTLPNIKNNGYNSDVDLLLNCMLFGISNIANEYQGVSIDDKEVL